MLVDVVAVGRGEGFFHLQLVVDHQDALLVGDNIAAAGAELQWCELLVLASESVDLAVWNRDGVSINLLVPWFQHVLRKQLPVGGIEYGGKGLAVFLHHHASLQPNAIAEQM